MMTHLTSVVFRAVVSIALLAALAIPTAHAQPSADKEKALQLYDQGTAKYNLGKWDDAISLFEQAYELYASPAFLFNVAQAARNASYCAKALRLYKLFLKIKSDAPNRAEVEGYIKEVETSCTEARPGAGSSDTGGSGTDTGGSDTGGSDTGGSGTDTGGSDTGGSDTDSDSGAGTDAGTVDGGSSTGGSISGSITEIPAAGPVPPPELFVARVLAGPAFHPGLSELETDVAYFALAIQAGYPLPVGPVVMDFGLFGSLTPMPWCAGCEMGAEPIAEGTAMLFTGGANVGATYGLPLRGLAARADLGIGGASFMGLGDRLNPFIIPDSEDGASAPLPAFHLRAAVGVQYMVIDNLTVHLQPTYGFTPAADGLREEISAMSAFQVMMGAGYQM